jgi:hypothetical protein
MRKQTTIEWLFEQIDNKDMGEVPMWIYDFCQEALQIEKQQIIEAHLAGQNSAEEIDGENEIEYFNKTY